MPPLSPRRETNAAVQPDGRVARGGPGVKCPLPAQLPTPPPGPMALTRFNSAPDAEISALLLGCCRSRRWSVRITACRPYPDLEALLAALDEASYDMAPQDLTEALEAESAELPIPGGTGRVTDQRGVLTAHTALRAAHSAYENRFGYPFLICLYDCRPEERLDQALSGVRSRLTSEPEEERVRAAEELRRLARGRLTRLVSASR